MSTIIIESGVYHDFNINGIQVQCTEEGIETPFDFTMNRNLGMKIIDMNVKVEKKRLLLLKDEVLRYANKIAITGTGGHLLNRFREIYVDEYLPTLSDVSRYIDSKWGNVQQILFRGKVVASNSVSFDTAVFQPPRGYVAYIRKTILQDGTFIFILIDTPENIKRLGKR